MKHSAEDLEWAREIMADRPRLDALIQEMRDGKSGAYDEIIFLTDCFNNGMPCADVDGRMGRLVDDDVEKFDESEHPRDEGGKWTAGAGIPVFHATSRGAAKKILSQGLHVDESWAGRPPSVFFTDSLDGAKHYASFLQNTAGKSSGYAVIEFRAPADAMPDDLDRKSPGHLAGKTPRLGFEHAMRVEHGVPADDIVAVHFFDKNGRAEKVGKSVGGSGFAVMLLDEEDGQ